MENTLFKVCLTPRLNIWETACAEAISLATCLRSTGFQGINYIAVFSFLDIEDLAAIL